MNFADALEAVLNASLPIARESWNGKGMFVYAVSGNSYEATSIVAKGHWGEGMKVPYSPYLAIKGADGVVSPWVPSQQDLFAHDWVFPDITQKIGA